MYKSWLILGGTLNLFFISIMTEKRDIKRHPGINFGKPSLIKREAIAEQLREALEALEPIRKNQLAIQVVIIEKTESQKYLVKTARPSGQNKVAFVDEWDKPQKAIIEALRNRQILNRWSASQKAITAALKPVSQRKDIFDQWTKSQKAIAEVLKPISQSKEIFDQWTKSQKAITEALKPISQNKEIFDQWTKSQKAITEALKPVSQNKEIFDQWTKSQKTITEALKPVSQNKEIFDQWTKYQKSVLESINQSHKYYQAVEIAKKIADYKVKK